MTKTFLVTRERSHKQQPNVTRNPVQSGKRGPGDSAQCPVEWVSGSEVFIVYHEMAGLAPDVPRKPNPSQMKLVTNDRALLGLQETGANAQ